MQPETHKCKVGATTAALEQNSTSKTGRSRAEFGNMLILRVQHGGRYVDVSDLGANWISGGDAVEEQKEKVHGLMK